MFNKATFHPVNPLFLTDSYKLSHRGFMTAGTEVIYSNMTPRSFTHMPVNKELFDNKIVWFNMQATLMQMNQMWIDGFFARDKKEVIAETKRIFDAYLGKDNIPMEHFEELHDLGYLPIRIKSLPEGSRVNGKVPFFTIRNTHNKFAWLTNFLETYLSAQLWKSATVATITYEYRKLANQFALETTGSTDGTEYQIHDFCFRGMSGWIDSMTAGAGFALSSRGSDNIPAIYYLEQYYGADCTKEFIMTSVPASEHSIACLGIAVEGELATYRKWITEDYPTGIVSVISDTVDFFRVVTEYATALAQDILNRQVNEHGLAKVVFRPDSGDPADIICGTAVQVDELPVEAVAGVTYRSKDLYWQGQFDENGMFTDWMTVIATPEQKGAVECLWDIFGGTVTEQGYRVLHERVGLIYGDSITLSRALEIFTRLKAKGYASINVVLGVGSFTCQYLTRDSAGMAVKATAAQVNGEWYELFKAPKTDDGTKKSAKGLLRVTEEDGNFVLHDQQTVEQEEQGCLRIVYDDGHFYNLTTLSEIRARLWGE